MIARSWSVGATMAVALHIGSACALFGVLPPKALSQDEDFGAVLIELSAVPVQQNADADDAPSAEDSEEKVATRDLQETLSAKREDDLPVEQAAPEKPKETDLQFAQERTQKEQEKASENEQVTEAMKPQEVQQQASQRSAASSDLSDTGDKQEDSKAAEFGSKTEAERRALEAWQKSLMSHLARHRRYPQKAREARLEGEALVRFSLDRTGTILERSIVHTAGSPILDGEALDMLKRSGSLPPPPPHMRGASIELTVPVRFRLKG